MTFEEVCRRVEAELENRWKSAEEADRILRLEKEKRAIMGFEEEAEEYRRLIGQIICDENLEAEEYPSWYKSLNEGVFNELYGLAGLAPWAYDETDKYKNSSSAKLIGDRLYCLIDGVSRLQPQTISAGRRDQLKRALLMSDPRERLDVGFHEVYLRNGIRITVYSGERTKDGQDVMVFRKYIMQDYTFEELVRVGTIEPEAAELFKTMAEIGFNVLFAGPVRSGKTTFMQVWQCSEKKDLEGLAISTDPETPWHILMPDVPLMQLVADGSDLENMTKSLLRGDNDYVILEEMRDAVAYRFALDIISTGTHRSKATVHTSDPVNLPFRMASQICQQYGGSLQGIIQQIFSGFAYVLELCSREDNRSEKRLKALWEYCYDASSDLPSVHLICRYDVASDNWQWKYHLGEDKRKTGSLSPAAIKKMEEIMKKLEERNPIRENTVIYPRYYRPHIAENPERFKL
ncbi:MAG: ATPase, T2SS/T4P/T4SS family [Anaerovoracaceae bacterium]